MATVHVNESFPCSVCKETNALNYWKAVEPKDTTENAYNYYSTCKYCIGDTIKDPFNLASVKKACEMLDIPFIESIWLKVATVNKAKKDNSALPKYSNMKRMTEDQRYHISTFTDYLKQAKLKANRHHFSGKGYAETREFSKAQVSAAVGLYASKDPKVKEDLLEIETLSEEERERAMMPIVNSAMNEVEDILDEFGQINVAKLSDMDKRYIIKKWGERYSWDDLLWLEEMWIKMSNSYDIVTASHEDYLMKICKISLAIEKYTEEENWDLVTQLGKMYDTWMKSAQFAESSKKKEKVDDSTPAVCQVIEMAEKLGFIAPFDLSAPKDIVDLTLNNMNAYTKRLVLSETNLSSLLEGAIEKMVQSENEKESELDDLPDEYDILEGQLDSEREVEVITSANFEDYQKHYENEMSKDLGSHDFEPEQGFDIDIDEDHYNEILKQEFGVDADE